MLLAFKKFGRRYRRFCETVRQCITPLLRTPHDPLTLHVADFKKSDTLFVLGSGASILDLPPEAWQDIRSADSFGVNLWLLHEHVPTWFSFELAREQEEIDLQMKLLRLRLDEYQNTAFLLRDVPKLDERCAQWREVLPLAAIRHLYTPCSLRISGRSERSLRVCLRWYRWLGYFRASEDIWGVPMKRASIFMTMSFALLAGYRRIVLCGVDLANTAYFYHDPRHEARGLPVPPMLPATAEELARKYTQHGLKMSQVPDPSVHNTIDPALNPLPMDKVIHAFNEEVLKPEGVELYVALPSSKLFPRIPALYSSLACTGQTNVRS